MYFDRNYGREANAETPAMNPASLKTYIASSGVQLLVHRPPTTVSLILLIPSITVTINYPLVC